jgi:hypothetical protein
MAPFIPANAPARDKTSGITYAMAILFVLVLVGTATVNHCSAPYSQARRKLSTDPCGAASLFAQDVRRDYKGSRTSLDELTKIDRPCALRELIDLMDLPDRTHTNTRFRTIIWENVQKRTAPKSKTQPAYEPAAAQAVRIRQKADWQRWYRENDPEALPATKRSH